MPSRFTSSGEFSSRSEERYLSKVSEISNRSSTLRRRPVSISLLDQGEPYDSRIFRSRSDESYIRPYINAETTAGGFPGWGTYTPGLWRTSNTTYLDAYAGYIQAVGSQIAANEITKGGPVILVQVNALTYTGMHTSNLPCRLKMNTVGGKPHTPKIWSTKANSKPLWYGHDYHSMKSIHFSKLS